MRKTPVRQRAKSVDEVAGLGHTVHGRVRQVAIRNDPAEAGPSSPLVPWRRPIPAYGGVWTTQVRSERTAPQLKSPICRKDEAAPVR